LADAPRPPGSRIARGLIAVLAVALAVAALANRAEWLRTHRDALSLVVSTGLSSRQPAVAADALWDPDPLRSRLAVARGLLAEAYDPDAFSKLPLREAADAASRLEERLDVARGIAADALVRLPAGWQAAMILGSATNRIWTLQGNPRLFTERSAWEGPLRAAAKLSPGQDEPLRPLAVAWLETWPLLSSTQRVEARETLRRAFADPDTFRQYAPLWLAAATDREEVFSLVPDVPWGWSAVEGRLAAREDWDGFCAARRRRDLAIRASADRRVGEAAEHLRGGDRMGARSLVLSVVDEMPADRRFSGTLASALANCPPGPVTASASAVRRWLDLALDGFMRGRTWLPPDALARLAASAGDLPAPVASLAALAAGDLSAAEVFERRAEAGRTETWAPYWVAKARVFARAHRVAEGRAALGRVNRNWAVSLPVLEARVVLAEAAGNATALEQARSQLDGAAAVSWPATAWVWRGPAARLDMYAVRDASGFKLTLEDFPPRGAVVQVSLDGTPVAVEPAFDREGLSVAVPVPRGPHLVEITAVAGGRVAPGELRLQEK